MPKVNDEWTVAEHGALETLAENLWRVEGSLPKMSLRRTMVIARMSDGRLVVHNAISLDADEMKKVDALGEVAFIVVPNGWHRLDAPAWKKRYPNAKVVVPRGAKKKVETCLAVDLTYDDFEGDENVRLEKIRGLGDAEGAMIVKSKDGTTLVLNDIVFNMEKKKDFWGWAFTTIFASAPGPRISRLVRIAMVKEKYALREDLEKFAELPDLTRLVVAHEKIASGKDAAAALREAATYL